MKIDVFNHIVTPRYRERRLQIAPPRMRLQDQERVMPTLFDLDARLRVMDTAGDGYVQIINTANPPVEAVAGPADALVLPSHGFPFVGLHTRLDQLVAHHDARLNDMTTAIARRGNEGATGWDMVPVLFPRHLDNNQIVFAFGETLAHLHCLETRARVKRTVVDGVHRFVALVDPLTQPPADDSDTDVMDTGAA